MAKILKFKSCAKGGEYNGLGAKTPTTYNYIGVDAPANIVTTINAAYADDPNLSGKVTGIGYGWQQFEIPSSGKVKFTVRGAAGGATGKSGFTINPSTGAVTGSGNRPGRGAKLVGEAKLKKGDILYMLVGMRGWCNDGSDWGSGGGGASVVLLDNPAGLYNFAPLNRKVDVLFVAGGGGGCYDSSFGTNYYGNDAVITDGTNTNGGTSSNSCGGAGLTGNGASGSGPSPAYNLLSGNVTTATLNTIHCGGWGGGGSSYDGGGSGAGYSGGNSRGNAQGGNGGTSYINPQLVAEISRGYATVDEDNERNLTNPWTAYGFIELELGRDENKFIIAKDNEGFKYFDGYECIDGTTRVPFTDEWKRIPGISAESQLTEEIYAEYGKTIINNRHGLNDEALFYISSKEPQEAINISGHVNGTVVEMAEDFSQADVSEIHSVTMSGNWQNVDIRLAFSKDYGKTWQIYSMGNWENINIKNKTEFQGRGLSINSWTSVPVEDIRNYNAKVIRIAFCITQNGASVTSGLLTEIKQLVDLIGAWRHFKEDEAEYEWATDSEVKVTFKQAGNYKVNYLDSLNPGSND